MKNNLNNLCWNCTLGSRSFSRSSTVSTGQRKTSEMEGRYNMLLNFLQSLNFPDLLTSR